MPPAAPSATTSAQAMQNLQGFNGSMQTPQQSLQKEEQGLGVQGDQQQVSGLQGAITNTTNLLGQVAPSVMGRTANSLVTSAQADAQIGNAEAPLNTQLNTENQDYDKANTNYTDALGQAETLAQADQTGQTDEQSYLQNIYNSLYTQEQNAAASAEQKREFDTSQANSVAASQRTAPTTPSLVGGGATTGATSGQTLGNATRNAVGGYAFTNAQGQPITMGQYLDMNGGNPQMAVQMLSQGSANDKQIAGQISALLAKGVTGSKLATMYPQVFGG